MLRALFALCAGLFAAMIVYTFLAVANAKWLLPPTGFDMNQPAEMQAFLSSLSAAALAWILAGWLLSALAGGGVAARLAGRESLLLAGLVGGCVALANFASVRTLAYPGWFEWSAALLPVPVALLAAMLVRRAWPAPGR